MHDAALDYLADQQVGDTWRGFLAALAQTLQAQLPPEALRPLMHATGEAFAQAHPLPTCEHLDELELAISRVWVNRHWGWVQLEEAADCLRLQHHCAPLALALGDPELAWSGAFLEGVYQVWLAQLGAGPVLTVRQTAVPDALSVVLELRR